MFSSASDNHGSDNITQKKLDPKMKDPDFKSKLKIVEMSKNDTRAAAVERFLPF